MTILLGTAALVFAFWAYALHMSLTNIRNARIEAEIARIEAGFASWTDPTPATPLRSLAWPTRQTPTDVAKAYEPVPWTDQDWALNELRYIVAANRQYAELVAAA